MNDYDRRTREGTELLLTLAFVCAVIAAAFLIAAAIVG